MRTSLRVAVGLLAVVAAAACRERDGAEIGIDSRVAPPGTEFAEWSLPVAAATPVHSYLHVAETDRTDSLQLERNLVLAEAFGEPLYRTFSVAVNEGGEIFVLDRDAYAVIVFAADGEALHKFGREGQGPGEFSRPRGIAVAGDRVFVHDPPSSRWIEFDTDGNHVIDRIVPRSFNPEAVVKDGDGFLVAARPPVYLFPPGVEGLPIEAWNITRRDAEMQTLDTIIEVDQQLHSMWSFGRGTAGPIPLRDAQVMGAIGDSGVAVLGTGEEYQVFAIEPSGAPLWALRVAYEPPVPTDEVRTQIIEQRQEGFPGTTDSDFKWPDRLAAIENIEVDANGNIYVFPHAGRTPEENYTTTRPVPVDVYNSAGEPIFSGWSDIEGWNDALGDYVYRTETDPETGERVVVRYRLTLPVNGAATSGS